MLRGHYKRKDSRLFDGPIFHDIVDGADGDGEMEMGRDTKNYIPPVYPPLPLPQAPILSGARSILEYIPGATQETTAQRRNQSALVVWQPLMLITTSAVDPENAQSTITSQCYSIWTTILISGSFLRNMRTNS